MFNISSTEMTIEVRRLPKSPTCHICKGSAQEGFEVTDGLQEKPMYVCKKCAEFISYAYTHI